MTPHLPRQRQLKADEAMQYGCEHCQRRWDDEQRPTKFTQRLAAILAIVVIVACLIVIRWASGGDR